VCALLGGKNFIECEIDPLPATQVGELPCSRSRFSGSML
jgi:hypothetical protein